MKKSLVVAAAAALMVLWQGGALGQTLTVGTNPQGSLFFSMGSAISKVMVEKTDKQYRVAPYAGSSTYIPLINTGKVDFGLANGGESAFAHSGSGNFDGRANDNLRLVGVAFATQTSFAVATDSDYKSLADLKGARLASNYTSGRTFHYYSTAALAANDLTIDDFKKVPMPNFVQAIKSFSQDRVDAALIPMNAGVGKKAMAEMSGGWRYLSLGNSQGAAGAVTTNFPSARLVPMTPSKKRTGVVDDPTYMIEVDFFVLAGAHVADEVVYELVKTMHANKPDLAAAFGAFNRFKPDQMVRDNSVPYHPGAIKFYKEIGIWPSS